MANFARDHGGRFGRIEVIRLTNARLQRLDLNDESVRTQVLQVNSNEALDVVFSAHPS
jgi:hypothetical protein